MRTLFKILLFSCFANCGMTQYVVNDAFKKITLALDNISSSGAIGTAFETVDHYSSFTINQTSSGKDFTLPTPNDATDGDDVTIRNIGSVSFTMYGVTIPPDEYEIHLTWKNGEWKPVGTYVANASCPCCDSLLYYANDTTAYYTGRINKDEFYLTSNDNTYGLAWGIYRQVPENYGYEMFDTIQYGFQGLMVISKNTTRVGFDAAFLAPCRIDPPAVDLPYYESDAAAITAGLNLYDDYQLSISNVYGLPKNFIKKIVEP